MTTQAAELKVALMKVTKMSNIWNASPPGIHDGLFAEALLALVEDMEEIKRRIPKS